MTWEDFKTWTAAVLLVIGYLGVAFFLTILGWYLKGYFMGAGAGIQ